MQAVSTAKRRNLKTTKNSTTKISKRKVKKFLKYVLGSYLGYIVLKLLLKFLWYSFQLCFAMFYGIASGIYLTYFV